MSDGMPRHIDVFKWWLDKLLKDYPGGFTDPYSWAITYLGVALRKGSIDAHLFADLVAKFTLSMGKQPTRAEWEMKTFLAEQEKERLATELERTKEERYLDNLKGAQEKREAEWRELHPEVEKRLGYKPKFEQIAEEVYAGVAGPRPWQDWFENKYKEELGKYIGAGPTTKELTEAQLTWAKRLQRELFMARKLGWMSRHEKKEAAEKRATYGLGWRPGMPEPTGYLEAELKVPEYARESTKRLARFKKMLRGPSPMERYEKSWAEYLRGREPELREEYETRYPYGLGGRPGAYQPAIRTVGF